MLFTHSLKFRGIHKQTAQTRSTSVLMCLHDITQPQKVLLSLKEQQIQSLQMPLDHEELMIN